MTTSDVGIVSAEEVRLRGQDMGKYIALAMLVAGSLLTTAAALTGWPALVAIQKALLRLLEVD